MEHTSSLDSDMNRAFSSVTFCASSQLLDMQLALLVALLKYDVLSLSNLANICGIHSCTFTAGVATDFVLALSNFIRTIHNFISLARSPNVLDAR